MAINALRNSQTISTETKGSISDVRISYPPELVAGFRSLFGAGKTYDFMLHTSSTQAATGGGVIAGYAAWTPSAFAEWSALAALFDETRLVSAAISWTTSFGPTSTAIICQIVLAPDFVVSGSASTFTPITRLAHSREFAIHTPGPGGASTLHAKVRVPRGRVYAIITSPTSSTVDCGWNGQWSFASNIVTTPSINYAFLVLRNIGRFRCRA